MRRLAPVEFGLSRGALVQTVLGALLGLAVFACLVGWLNEAVR